MKSQSKRIELFGMPGSGKSYWIHTYHGKISLQAGEGNFGLKKYIKKVFLLTPYGIYHYLNLTHKLNTNNECSKIIGHTSKGYLKRIVLLASIYHYLSKNIIVDEGIVHRIITFVVAFDYDDATAFYIIDYFMSEIVDSRVIYIRACVEDCFHAIRNRNRHDCTFDELNDNDLLIYLNKYSHLSDLIINKYRFEVFNNWPCKGKQEL